MAGIWGWPGGLGNPVFIYSDGTWEHEPSDVSLYGDVSIMESNGYFSLEFIITRAEGPGAFGWIPPGETRPAAGTEHGFRSGDVWISGVYSPTTNELHFKSQDGSMILMEKTDRLRF